MTDAVEPTDSGQPDAGAAGTDYRPTRFGRDDVEFGRSLAYVDATFAIATTLLVTTLIPGPEAWRNWSTFWETQQGPLLAFALSFVVISSFWWGNHRLVAALGTINTTFVIASLVMLAFVAVVPFTTDGLGSIDGSDGQVATVVYAVNIALVSLSSTALIWVAYRDRLFRRQPTPENFRWTIVAVIDTPIVFLVSVPVALFVSVPLARWMWLLLILTGTLTNRSRRRSMAR